VERQVSFRSVRATAQQAEGALLTRRLLGCGVVAGSLFITVALVQAFTRPGFDIRRHPLSLLSLGDLGWIQVADFIASGALVLAFAIGARRVLYPGRAGTWGPLLIGAFGLGLIIAGIFHPDPALGFPPGSPAGTPTTLSWHNWLHTVGFATSFISVTAACFVFARRFSALRQRAWTVYCAATGVLTPSLIVLGMAMLSAAGPAFAVAGALASFWIAAMAAKLAASHRSGIL
jgi:hypothetical membrane protein